MLKRLCIASRCVEGAIKNNEKDTRGFVEETMSRTVGKGEKWKG